MKQFDTIAAVSTPPGVGGIAIIRVSGSEAEEIAQNIIRTKSGMPLKELDSHKLTLCDVMNSQGELLDEALVAVMRKMLILIYTLWREDCFYDPTHVWKQNDKSEKQRPELLLSTTNAEGNQIKPE